MSLAVLFITYNIAWVVAISGIAKSISTSEPPPIFRGLWRSRLWRTVGVIETSASAAFLILSPANTLWILPLVIIVIGITLASWFGWIWLRGQDCGCGGLVLSGRFSSVHAAALTTALLLTLVAFSVTANRDPMSIQLHLLTTGASLASVLLVAAVVEVVSELRTAPVLRGG